MKRIFSYSKADLFLRYRSLCSVNKEDSSEFESCEFCDLYDDNLRKEKFETLERTYNENYSVCGHVTWDIKSVNQKSSPVIIFQNFPGLFYLPKYLPDEDQLCLANECLRDYVNSGNPSNLEPIDINNSCCEKDQIQKRNNDRESAVINFCNSQRVGRYWPEPQIKKETTERLNFLKLKWVTLGKHYEWTSRSYKHESQQFDEFPEILKRIAKKVVNDIDEMSNSSCCINSHKSSSNVYYNSLLNKGYPSSCHFHEFTPNAAILNIYRGKDRLGGHRDDAEHTCDADITPLVSISLGIPCYFLLAESSQSSIKPLCIVLRSGDILILSCQSRLLYHGVPRVFGRGYDNCKNLAFLCRKERRKRLQWEMQNQEYMHFKNQQSTPNICYMDHIFSEIHLSKKDISPENDSCKFDRLSERSGPSRDMLLNTMSYTRLNLSIRQKIDEDNSLSKEF
jgi:alkylated DNA repair dioxygenase AlkB